MNNLSVPWRIWRVRLALMAMALGAFGQTRTSCLTCPGFSASLNYGTGSSPTAVALGDLNGDGKSDLAVANSVSSNVSVLLGNGAGAFSTAVNYAVGLNPWSVVIADFNGNGAPDLAVANYSSSAVSILMGQGNGAFAAAVNYATASSPYSLAVGDLNGNGTLDLAVAGLNSSTVSILLGNGNGTFAAPVNYSVGTYASSVAVGDVNGDGKLDVAVTTQLLDTATILLGNGNGTFGTGVAYATGSSPQGVSLGDVNRDGKLDLVTANLGGASVSVLLGNGNGTFAGVVNYAAGSQPLSAVLGDVDGDGNVDIAVASSASNVISLLQGNGNGTFASAIAYAVGAGPEAVAFGDPNGDGKPDLAVANRGSSNASILLNISADCTGIFADDPLSAGMPIRVAHINELRSAANGLRSRQGLSEFSFTDSPLIAGSTPIRAVHLVELRAALAGIYSARGIALPTYADSTITAGTTAVRQLHIAQLRSVVRDAGLFWLTVIRAGNGGGTLTSAQTGIDCGTSCSKSYLPATVVTLTATPATDSTFTGWSGACSGTGTCQVTMGADTSVTATFTVKRFTLTVTKAGNGTGTLTSSPAGVDCGSDCQETYDIATSVTLTPAPATGSTFSGWTGACSGTGGCTVAMNDDATVGATFILQQFSLTVSKSGNGTGTVTSNPAGINCGFDCQETYNYPTSVTLTAAPASGATFAGWSGACTGTGTCQLTMSAARSVTATFTVPIYAMTVTKSGTGSGTVTSSPAGISCGADCAENYNAGTSVTLSRAAAAGSYFVNWTGACSGTGTCTIAMSTARAVGAVFNIIQPFTLTVEKSGTGSGTVTSSPAGINCGADCSEVYTSGTSVTLTASAPDGSYFANWTGACSEGGTCTVPMHAATTVGAVFNIFTIDIDIARGTVRMPNKYREGSWSVGGQPQTNFVAIPPGWSVGGQPQTNFVALPPGWSVGGQPQTNFIGVPPGWSVGGGSATNFVAVPPGWSVGGQPQTNYITLPPGWTDAGEPQTHYLALPPGWSLGGAVQTNFVALPSEWTTGGQPQTNFVGLAPGWTAGGQPQTNFVSLPPGWTAGGEPQTNFVTLPPGWIVGGQPQTNFVAYPGANLTTIEFAFNDPGWLAFAQLLKTSGAMSDSAVADVLVYCLLGTGRHLGLLGIRGLQGMAPSGWWR